jgi:hypothetical protein
MIYIAYALGFLMGFLCALLIKKQGDKHDG